MISIQENNSNNNNFMPTHFSNMNISSSGHKSPVENFLKEAIQILIEASRTVNPISNNTTTDNLTDTHLQNNSNNKQKSKQKKKIINNNNNNNDINDNNNVVIHSNDDDDDKAPWVINVTWNQPFISVETDIKSLSGLEGVFEYIRTSGVNLLPPASASSASSHLSSLLPPASDNTTNVSSDQYQIHNFIFAISETLRLSQVAMISKMDIFRQYHSVQLMNQCVCAFIKTDGALFMDVDLLMKKTEYLLSSPAHFYNINNNNNSNNENEMGNPLDTLLVLSICSMMVRHVMVHQLTNIPSIIANNLARIYYKQAEQILEDVFDIPHISVLQSMFILSLYPHGHVDFFSLFRYSSNKLKDTIRMALAMRLDQLDLQPRSSNPMNKENDIGSVNTIDFNKEYKRRLAWMILCADHASDINYQASNSGLIDVKQWHVHFPQPLPNENTSRRVEFFSHFCQMIMIRKMQLFRSAYMVVSQSPEALATRMDEELFNRYKNTPQPFSILLDLDNMIDPSPTILSRTWTRDDLESLLLEALHYNTSIMAFIPFLPRRYFYTFDNGQLLRDSNIQEVYRLMTNQASVSDFIVSPLPPSSLSTLQNNYHSSLPSSTSMNKKGKKQHQNKKQKNNHNHTDDEYNEDDFKHLDDLEMHTVIRCLTAANKYVYVLEKLNEIDPIYCFYQTIHAIVLMLYVFDMIQTNCQQYDVALTCKLNLIRLLRITKYIQKLDRDPTLIYLERMINNCTDNSTDESSMTLERKTISLINKLQIDHP